jgi:hypothetical protein
VLVSAEQWQRLEELESAGATAWWRRDAAGVLTQVRSRGRGRKALGLDEAGFRRRFAHLFRDACAA